MVTGNKQVGTETKQASVRGNAEAVPGLKLRNNAVTSALTTDSIKNALREIIRPNSKTVEEQKQKISTIEQQLSEIRKTEKLKKEELDKINAVLWNITLERKGVEDIIQKEKAYLLNIVPITERELYGNSPTTISIQSRSAKLIQEAYRRTTGEEMLEPILRFNLDNSCDQGMLVFWIKYDTKSEYDPYLKEEHISTMLFNKWPDFLVTVKNHAAEYGFEFTGKIVKSTYDGINRKCFDLANNKALNSNASEKGILKLLDRESSIEAIFVTNSLNDSHIVFPSGAHIYSDTKFPISLD